jgi:hypothetical protein
MLQIVAKQIIQVVQDCEKKISAHQDFWKKPQQTSYEMNLLRSILDLPWRLQSKELTMVRTQSSFRYEHFPRFDQLMPGSCAVEVASPK